MDLPVDIGVPHAEWSPGFRRHLDEILPVAGDALDLGTGTGRVALHVAPRARRVVAVDIDGAAIQAAQEAAGRLGIRNIKFYAADAERVAFLDLNDGSPYELITAHLYFSLPLIDRAFHALQPGGHFLSYALSQRHWREAGGSRFNVDPPDVTQAFTRTGFDVKDLRLEEFVHVFDSTDEAKVHLKERRVWAQWSQDGRWDRWKSTFRSGSRRLTESRLLAWARKPVRT